MNSSNLKSIQRNMYQSYFSDGVWDLVIGLIYLIAGLGVWIDQAFWYAFPLLLAVLPIGLKRWITFPRIGHIQFKQSKKLWISALFFLIGAVLFVFLYFISANNTSGNPVIMWLTQNLFVIIGLLIGLFFVLTGKIFYFQRLYLYAVITVIGFTLMFRVFPSGITLTVMGTLISGISLIVIRNFMQHHPIQNNPEITQEAS